MPSVGFVQIAVIRVPTDVIPIRRIPTNVIPIRRTPTNVTPIRRADQRSKRCRKCVADGAPESLCNECDIRRKTNAQHSAQRCTIFSGHHVTRTQELADSPPKPFLFEENAGR